MEFRRKKKRGQSQKVRRTWFSEEGYRIVWRKEVYGVRVPACFQACVRTLVPCDDSLRPMWDFVNRGRRLMKTLQAARDECEKHKRLWTKACEATGIRALKELFGGKLPLGFPQWTRKKMDRRLYAILTDNRPTKYRNDEEDESCTESSPPSSDAPGPGGPIETSDSSVAPTEPIRASDNLASSSEGKGKSTIRRTRKAQAKAAPTSDAPDTSSARKAAKGRRSPAAKRIKQSKPTAKRRTITNDSSAAGANRSKGSRKSNVTPSRSQDRE